MKKLIMGLCALSLSFFSIVGVTAFAADESVESDTVIETVVENETEAIVTETETETETEPSQETTLVTTKTDITTTSELATKLGDFLAKNKEKNGKVEIEDETVIFTGQSTKVNVFDLSDVDINSTDYTYDYQIPEFSYVVINVSGKDVNLYTQAGISYKNTTQDISTHIIFNCSEAETVTIFGEEAIYGTIYAPNAEVKKDGEKVLVTGEIYAKNVEEGISVKNAAFNYFIKDYSALTAVNTSTNITSITRGTTVTITAAPKTGYSTKTPNMTLVYVLSGVIIAAIVAFVMAAYTLDKEEKE